MVKSTRFFGLKTPYIASIVIGRRYWEVVEQTNIKNKEVIEGRSCGVRRSFLVAIKRGNMGQTITNADMTLEEKLQAIAQAINAADGANA